MFSTRRTRSRTWAAAALTVSLSGLLAGCTTTGDPTSAPTPTPSAPAITETPQHPVDPLDGVVVMVLHPDRIELRDEAGAVVDALDYMGDAGEAVVTVATVLGADPVSEAFQASTHDPSGIVHRWDGFELIERHYDEQQRVDDDLDNLVWPRISAVASASEVEGVRVTSAGGAVGDRADQLAAPIDPELRTCLGWAVETVEVPRRAGPAVVGTSLTFSGWTDSTRVPPAPDETVTVLRAPEGVRGADDCI